MDRIDDISHCFALRPVKKVQFYNFVIQKRRHFKIIESDIERKTTSDSSILVYFGVGMDECKPF